MTAPDREKDFVENLGETIGYIEAFAERKIQLAKLEVAEKVAKTTATMATGMILMALFPVVLCVLSVAVGFLLVESFGWSFAASFFLLTGIYVAIGALLVIFRKALLTNPVLETVIQELFKK